VADLLPINGCHKTELMFPDYRKKAVSSSLKKQVAPIIKSEENICNTRNGGQWISIRFFTILGTKGMGNRVKQRK